MDLYPAIDLRGGRVVRLHQGDYERETHYGDDAVAVAVSFADAGARWIHVVDLDAARTAEPVNRPIVADVVAALAGRSPSVSVQSGGGVRSVAAAEALIEAGVARVAVGTSAVEDPRLLADMCDAFPGRIAAALDARDGEVAVRGWTSGSGTTLDDAVDMLGAAGVAAFIVTDIARDGTQRGPDVDGLAAVLERSEVPVIASGGVGTLDDLRALASLERGGRRLTGAVVGRALYEGSFTVREAVQACVR